MVVGMGCGDAAKDYEGVAVLSSYGSISCLGMIGGSGTISGLGVVNSDSEDGTEKWASYSSFVGGPGGRAKDHWLK